MNILVVGGAGFIGSVLIERLLEEDNQIIVIDNLKLGKTKYLKGLNIRFYQEDINNIDAVVKILKDYSPIEEVWHLAANSDIPSGIKDIEVDLNDTFLSTVSVLRVMEIIGCKRLYFSSTSAIYGPHDNRLEESTGPLFPISNYGAMKLASEAIISSFLESYLETASIYRFPNVVGIPATHGVILDFIRRLKDSPNALSVLGNGTQQKVYIHVDELIDAMLFINQNSKDGLNCFNIGPEDLGVTVKEIAEHTVERVSPNAKIVYGDENRGWVGDIPSFSFSIEKLKGIGYEPQFSSLDSILKAINEIAIQEGF